MTIELKEKIREFNPIKEVVAEIVPLKGNTGRCPKHDDRHPSFSVNSEKGICRCWAGCTKGALDVFGFYQWYFDCTFPEAMQRLAKRVGIVIEKSESKNHKKDSWEELKDLAAVCRISCQRWKRNVLNEIGLMQAEWSQKQRKRAYEQYKGGVITEFGLERRLLGLERRDEEFENKISRQKHSFKDLR